MNIYWIRVKKFQCSGAPLRAIGNEAAVPGVPPVVPYLPPLGTWSPSNPFHKGQFCPPLLSPSCKHCSDMNRKGVHFCPVELHERLRNHSVSHHTRTNSVPASSLKNKSHRECSKTRNLPSLPRSKRWTRYNKVRVFNSLVNGWRWCP